MSHSNSQGSCLDPLDSLLDLSEYDKLSYQSPSISPSAIKSQFVGRAVSNTPATLPSSIQQDLSGPSHNYGLYKQQTGIPQGAVASTLAVNQMNQYGYADSYLSGIGGDDFVDFGTAPTRNGSFNADMDMEFDSPLGEPAYFYPEQSSPEFVNPSAIGSSSLSPTAVLPTQTSNVGRLWPGMHQQQAALAKAQAQQKQQQQIIQQQRNNAMSGHQRQPSQQRPRGSHQPADPIVEEKISQLLNSMRQSSVATEDGEGTPNANHLSHVQRMRKEEEDMDEDERLLASEEGKKLSSKERRQLRNKVSARAFRSRRKEYISQLEGEIATKVNENNDLRSQNRALLEENTRLSDLTRMLLSSPSFSGFLDTLASNPQAAQTAQAVQQPQPPQQIEQPQRQIRKDINPYAAQQQMQQQQIGMAMIPEHNMDFSMLDLNENGAFSYQPQVFSVLSLPEAVIDTDILSGKTSSFAPLASDDEKVELPTVERMPVSKTETVELTEVEDSEFDADPAFALYTSSPAIKLEPTLDLSFLANLSLKPSNYELVVVPEIDEATADAAMRRVERLSADMDACLERLSRLSCHL
jgi:hypothetical protein